MTNLEYLLVVGVGMAGFGGIAFLLYRVLIAATEIESFLFVLPFG